MTSAYFMTSFDYYEYLSKEKHLVVLLDRLTLLVLSWYDETSVIQQNLKP